jgi:gas vesicle protein
MGRTKKGKENMSRGTDTLVGLLIGAAAGGITALLLAPEKGSITRRRLRAGGDKMVHDSKDMASHAATTIGEVAREKSHTVSEAARNQVNAVRGAVAEAKETYHRELEKS